MNNDERMAALRRMCGYVENGSDTTIKIFQDDATKEWFVKVGSREYHGPSMISAFDAAVADHPKEEWE